MKGLLLLLGLILLMSVACSEKSYVNKLNYELKIGESVEIYYSTNSCCYYCFAKEQDLKHLTFIEEKTVDSGPENCSGCNFTGAFVFKATSVGFDTIKLKSTIASESCFDASVAPQEYFVRVQ